MTKTTPISDVLWERHNITVTAGDYFDTGIKLLENDISWTVAFDMLIANFTTATAPNLAYCGGTAQFRVFRGGAGGQYKMLFKYKNNEFRPSANNLNKTNTRYRFVVTHTSGANGIEAYCRRGTDSMESGTVTASFSQYTGNLFFGTSGAPTDTLPNGTINHAVVYNRVLSTEEINAFMGVTS